MTFKARIRGIYSTAITKLLLENGFEIVQPSPTIRERLKLEENMKSPDMDIYDRRNRQGIHVVGTAESLDTLKAPMLRHLDDVIFRKQPFLIDGVYKGVIKKGEEAWSFVSVDLGSFVGKLSRSEVDTESPSIVVQVQKEQTSTKEPWLSIRINIPGEHAVLIPEGKIKVSLKIRDIQRRMDLIELGRKIAPPDWGIIWRTSAESQPKDVLESEIHRLIGIRDEIFRKAREQDAPALLWGSQHYMNVEFPSLSKARLDEVRSRVAPTIEGHHYYKACGKGVSMALEMAEKMLENNVSNENVKNLFHQTVDAEFPIEGSVVNIEHVKPEGRAYHLGKARIEKRFNDELSYSRVFKTEGFYDGLGTPKEPGDRAVTEAKIGGWHYTTRYFSKDGMYKGAHVNLNTPLELYPRWIRYVDLEVDVCVLPDGTVKVIDEDELEKAVANGFVGEKLAALVKGKTSKILENLRDPSI